MTERATYKRKLRVSGAFAKGLPRGHASPSVAFHYQTGSVVVHTRPRTGKFPSARLSIRRVHDSSYRPIAKFPTNISLASFAMSQTRPLLYFTTWAWADFNDTVGGDWDALYRFDLRKHTSELVARNGKLLLPKSYSSAWLTDLLAVSEDGQTLFSTAGLQGARGDVRYFVCELSLTDLRITPLTRLESPFA